MTTKAQAAVAYAEHQVNKPYVWGADGPDSYDCSGLMQAAYDHVGIDIGRTTLQQRHNGKRVNRKNLQPGDLIFPTPGYDHVQMYKGDGKVVEAASPRKGIRNAKLGRVFEARRIDNGSRSSRPKGHADKREKPKHEGPTKPHAKKPKDESKRSGMGNSRRSRKRSSADRADSRDSLVPLTIGIVGIAALLIWGK